MEKKQVTVSEKKIEESVKNDKIKGLINQALSILVAFSAFGAIAGIKLDWLSPELIDSFGTLVYAVAGFAITIYGIYKNNYSGKKATLQNKVLKEKGLKK